MPLRLQHVSRVKNVARARKDQLTVFALGAAYLTGTDGTGIRPVFRGIDLGHMTSCILMSCRIESAMSAAILNGVCSRLVYDDRHKKTRIQLGLKQVGSL